jgi:hypothetical protein
MENEPPGKSLNEENASYLALVFVKKKKKRRRRRRGRGS